MYMVMSYLIFKFYQSHSGSLETRFQFCFQLRNKIPLQFCTQLCNQYDSKFIHLQLGMIFLALRPYILVCIFVQFNYLTTHTSLSPIWRGFTPDFTKKGALDSQPQVIKFTSYLHMVGGLIKFTSYLHMVGGSLRVLRLLPPLKLVAMIQLKVQYSQG